MTARSRCLVVVFALGAAIASSIQAANPIPVTADNFVRAETDLYFGSTVKEAGGTGKFHHNRAPTPIDRQLVIRMNRDTLYSAAVFDLDAGPVTVTLPAEEYIVPSRGASRSRIQEALVAPPVEAIERPYSLDEIRGSERLRAKLRRIDIDTVNFEFGAATVGEDQVPNLQAIGNALAAIIGTTAGFALWLMNVPYFYVLALIAGLGEMIPVVGPILSAIPAVGVAMTVSPATENAM